MYANALRQLMLIKYSIINNAPIPNTTEMGN